MASFERHVEVDWTGSVMEGKGEAKAGTGAFTLPVTFPARIGEPAGKTSPEELMAAAHAACILGGHHLPSAPPMSDEHDVPPPPPTAPGRVLGAHELRRLGSDFLRRANDHMAHARHGGLGGGAYVPLQETAAEHAGHYLVQHGSPAAALASLDYQLRNLDPGENETLWREARAILAHTPRAVAEDWEKLLNSAVANAEHNHELLGDDLRILSITADEGPTLKRFQPRAMGRASRIRKRTSHLSIALTPKEQ